VVVLEHTSAWFLDSEIHQLVFMRWRKVKVPQYNKLDEKDSVHTEVTTKDSNGWKYKKLEDAEGDSSDSTTKDEHKKMLN